MADLYSISLSTVFVFPSDTPNDGTPSGSDVRQFSLSGFGSFQQIRGATLDGDDLYCVSDGQNRMYVFPKNTANSGSAVSTRFFNLPSGLSNPSGLTVDGDNLYCVDYTDDKIYVFPKNTVNEGTPAAMDVRSFNLPSGLNNPSSLVVDGNDLYCADEVDNQIYVFPKNTADGGTPSGANVRVFNLPSYTDSENIAQALTSPQGLTVDGNDLYCSDHVGNEVFVFPKNTANGQTAIASRRFNLPSGASNPRGLSIDPISQAALTISTTDTDIRAGESVDINITSDIDITDFVASDITVTGGTRGALTGSGTAWTLSVTAGAAGTMTVAIAEDAVSPGNTAVSQDFTVNARLSVSLAFDETSLETDGTTQVTATWSESVSGVVASELTTSAGTLSNFSHSGSTTTATLTAPSSGSGTIVITMAANAASAGGLGNIATTASIAYAEPAEPLTIGWVVPTQDVGLSFSVTLTSNMALSGVEIGDFILRRQDGQFTTLTSSNTTLTNVSGTNNWRLDITLTGTHDHNFIVRLRPNRVTANGVNVPVQNSPEFHVDSSITPEATVAISTDDTDIRVGETVDIDFVFSESVTGFVAGDITITGGTRGALTGSGTSWTLSVTAGSAGTMTVSVAEDVVTEGNAAASQDFTINALPTVTITASDADIRINEAFTVTFQWSESVSGFATGDITVTGGAKGTFSSVDGDTYTLGITADASAGDIVVTVASNAVTLGNAQTAETFTSSALPTVAITFDVDRVVAGEDVTATFQWSESVTGFATGDVTLSTGTKGTFTAVDGDTYTLAITAPSTGSGTIDVTVNANGASQGNAETVASIDYAEVNLGWTVPTETVGNTFNTTLTSNFELMGVAVDDFILRRQDGQFTNLTGANATLAAVANTNNHQLTITLTGTFDHDFQVRLRPNRVQINGNNYPSSALTSDAFHVDSDTGAITATLSTTDTDIRAGEVFDVSISFSEAVTGFTASDITVTGGTRGALSGSGSSYTLSVTAGSAGTLTVAIGADAVTEGNVAASQNFTVNALPTVTITSDDSNIRINEEFTVTFQWSETVSGFVAGDVTVTGGTKGTFTSVDGDTYTLGITADSSAGDIDVTVAAGAVTLGNAETSETFTSSALPTVDITFSETTAEALEDFTVTFQWSETVSGFATGDVTISDGTKGTFTAVDGDTYTLVVTAPTSGSGSIEVTVAADAVNEGNAEYSESVSYATTDRTVTISTTESTIHENEVFDVDIVFSRPVTGFVAGDITVMNGTRGTLTETDSENYVLSVTAGTMGTLRVSIAADVVVQGNASASEDFTVTVDSDMLSIESIDEQFIPIGTEDYDLEIDIGGNPDTVEAGGLQEGFYQDWDENNNRLHIKADKVTRLIGGAEWEIVLTKGSDTLTGTILYNVVPSAPVIDDPGSQLLFRGVNNMHMISVANSPSLLRGDSPLVALKYDPAEDEDGNAAISSGGMLPENARLSFDEFNANYYAENSNGSDEIAVPFTIKDKPNMLIGATDQTIFRIDEDTPSSTTPDIFAFTAPITVDHLVTGLLVDGDDIYVAAKGFSSAPQQVVQFPKDTQQNTVATDETTYDLSSFCDDPQGIAAGVNPTLQSDYPGYYVLDRSDRTIHAVRLNSDGTATSLATGILPSNLTKPMGLHIDADEDVYVVDLQTRRVNVFQEHGSGSNNIYGGGTFPYPGGGTIAIQRYFTLPTGCNAPGGIFVDDDYCYVVDFADSDEDGRHSTGETAGLQCKVYIMDKDTANAATATAVRVIDIPTDYLYCQAIFIES